MTTDLTARLLAEIERREGIAFDAIDGVDESSKNGIWFGYEASPGEYEEFIAANEPSTILAYLAALRKVIELHKCETSDFPWESTPFCETCEVFAICDTLRAVAGCLGVDVG